MAVIIDSTKCTGCGSCAEACPLEAMTVNDGLAAADPETCVECGICMEACTNGAVSLP
ncbi:MAG: 4Fe-4S binding protein [Syntrophorhabdus sp.]|nr:4Fe-4S binding protein [Syntrophorhabdus sp.]